MSPQERPQLLVLKSPPPGDYDTWTEEERFNAEHHCYCFAQEYMVDHDASQASLRLGFPVKECAVIGLRYSQHWLTQHYLKEIRRSFRQSQHATHDTVMALLYRDASNFGAKANPMARVSAQKQLCRVLDMDAPKKVEKSVTSNSPGIMLVPHSQSLEAWEAEAMEKQARLKQEARD